MFWLLPLLALAGVTIPLAVADLCWLRLPNVLLVVGYASLAVAAELTSLTAPWSGAATPALACAVALCAAGALRAVGAVGMGDVKLVGLLAGILQLVPHSNSPPPLLIAAGATLVLVAPAAMLAILRGRRVLPLGPFLLAGFWLAVLA